MSDPSHNNPDAASPAAKVTTEVRAMCLLAFLRPAILTPVTLLTRLFPLQDVIVVDKSPLGVADNSVEATLDNPSAGSTLEPAPPLKSYRRPREQLSCSSHVT
jgi:hypothetical protein